MRTAQLTMQKRVAIIQRRELAFLKCTLNAMQEQILMNVSAFIQTNLI